MPAKESEPVWCLVMFDLPVRTRRQTREATRFRHCLLDLGFCRSQLSVYVQYLPLAARMSKLVRRIKAELPAGGEVRILAITDRQWAKAIRFFNQEEQTGEDPPPQLTIF